MNHHGHEFEEHTGEVRLHVRAPDFPTLLHEAALGLSELQAERPPIELGQPEELEVEGRDRAALLVSFLDELIYRSEQTGLVYPWLQVRSLEPTRVRATVRGGAPESWKTAVKAATFHDLRVEETPDGLEARVVLDV